MCSTITAAERQSEFFQSVPIMDGRENLRKYGLDERKRNRNQDVALALQSRQRKKYGFIEFYLDTGELPKNIKLSELKALAIHFGILGVSKPYLKTKADYRQAISELFIGRKMYKPNIKKHLRKKKLTEKRKKDKKHKKKTY